MEERSLFNSDRRKSLHLLIEKDETWKLKVDDIFSYSPIAMMNLGLGL